MGAWRSRRSRRTALGLFVGPSPVLHLRICFQRIAVLAAVLRPRQHSSMGECVKTRINPKGTPHAWGVAVTFLFSLVRRRICFMEVWTLGQGSEGVQAGRAEFIQSSGSGSGRAPFNLLDRTCDFLVARSFSCLCSRVLCFTSSPPELVGAFAGHLVQTAKT